LAEGLLEITVAHRVRQVTDVQFVAHQGTPINTSRKAMESRKHHPNEKPPGCAKLSDHRIATTEFEGRLAHYV
jgi:hypothetical protein